MDYPIDFYQKKVAISGKFEKYSKEELAAILQGLGVWYIGSGVSKQTDFLFSAEEESKKTQKANDLDKPILFSKDLDQALGDPLRHAIDRLKRFLDFNRVELINFAVGKPIDTKLVKRIEKRIGFPLDQTARNLFTQFDGLTLLWANETLPFPKSEKPIEWSAACDDGGEIWTKLYKAAEKDWLFMGLICIPPAETIFFHDWDGKLFDSKSYGPKDKLKVGKKKVGAKDFYTNLFPFDFFHPFYQAALWADQESKELRVVYGSDHGACWTDFHPIPLRVYMETLLYKQGSERFIKPVSKTAWTQGISKIAGNQYPTLQYRLR